MRPNMWVDPSSINKNNCLVCATAVGAPPTRKRVKLNGPPPSKRVKYLTFEDSDRKCTPTSRGPPDKSRWLGGLRPASINTSGGGMDPFRCFVRVPTIVSISEALQCIFHIDVNENSPSINPVNLVLCERCAAIMVQLYPLHRKLNQLTSDLSFLASVKSSSSSKSRTSSVNLVPQMFEQKPGEDDGVLNVVEYVTVFIKTENENEDEVNMNINESNGGGFEAEGNNIDDKAGSSDQGPESVASEKIHKNAKSQTQGRRRSDHSGHSPRRKRCNDYRGVNFDIGITCSICGKPYTRFENTREHMFKHLGPDEERPDKVLKCLRCRQAFLGPESLKRHTKECQENRQRRSRNGPTVQDCLTCDRRISGNTSDEATFQGQQISSACKLHKGKICDICGRNLSRGDNEVHNWSHLGREERQAVEKHSLCPHCGLGFPFERKLYHHIYNTHGPNAVKLAQLIRKPAVKSTGMAGIRYKCPKCDDTFTQEINMKTHLKSHDLYEGRTFPCPACQQVFYLPHQLINHRVLCDALADERPHQCSTCGRRYKTNKDMKRHLKLVHLGQKGKE